MSCSVQLRMKRIKTSSPDKDNLPYIVFQAIPDNFFSFFFFCV